MRKNEKEKDMNKFLSVLILASSSLFGNIHSEHENLEAFSVYWNDHYYNVFIYWGSISVVHDPDCICQDLYYYDLYHPSDKEEL